MQPLSDILAALPVPALLVSRSEYIACANVEARTLLGQQIEQRHYAMILRQPDIATAIEGTLADTAPRQVRYLDNDGSQDTTFDVTCRWVPSLQGVLVTLLDVTPVEQAGQMRRDFVANVSHELRTPLTALMGFIETLRGAAANDAAARDRFLGIMEQEAGRMNRLVGDLLSLSRVESQERMRPRDKVDLAALVTSVVRSLTPLARDAKVDLNLDGVEGEVIVPGDEDQLRQVFTNLVENAIKYGGSGGRVSLKAEASDRDPALRLPSVRVQVQDNGPGIDPMHLPRLTERFYRADSHRSRMLGGTGLGLAIVKHIVNRHRGRLRVESDLGHGATFTVILPAE